MKNLCTFILLLFVTGLSTLNLQDQVDVISDSVIETVQQHMMDDKAGVEAGMCSRGTRSMDKMVGHSCFYLAL